jgi:hypothetical protein
MLGRVSRRPTPQEPDIIKSIAPLTGRGVFRLIGRRAYQFETRIVHQMPN